MKNTTTKITIALALLFALHGAAQSNLNSSWRFYRPGNTGIQGDNATAIWLDANGDPYIAANTGNWGEGGFAQFNQSSNQWTNYSNVDLPVLGGFDNGDIQINDIVKDPNGRLWMAKKTGAIYFDPAVGAASIVNYDTSNSLLLGFSSDVDIAPDGSVWFVSEGLVRYQPQQDQWTTIGGANPHLAVQPKPDGSYLVWSADSYYGYVFQYNSATQTLVTSMPEALGDVAGLPGKDCVDEAGNFWAVRMGESGGWETLEYQRPTGEWVYPVHPYENVSFYINDFKAFGDGKAAMVLASGETWLFDGTTWHNYGTWRPGDFNMGIDVDQAGNIWVCGLEGAAKRDVTTGLWQRYRLTNTAQIDYMIEDLAQDDSGHLWFTGNAGTGIGGIQEFDGARWTGFNPYTYGLGHDFPYDADNATAIANRPSAHSMAFSPTFHGVHTWNGSDYTTLDGDMTTSKGMVEDSQGRLWSLNEYFSYRFYDNNTWTTLPIVGWCSKIIEDPTLPGTVWAMTDNEIQRTNGTDVLSITGGDFPGSAAWLTGLAVQPDGTLWTGTWSQFSSAGSTLIKYNPQTAQSTVWSYDQGWPFPGEHVRPLTVTPDGRIWMLYDSEFPSLESGIFAYDGVNLEIYPSAPGGFPAWDVLPNSNIKDIEVKTITGGYELWMSCVGRGIAVLTVLDENLATQPLVSKTAGSMVVYPNPARDTVKITFENKVSGFCRLVVHDLTGRKVATLLEGNCSAGMQRINWNLSAQGENSLVKGVYLLSLETTKGTASSKLVIE